MRNFSSYIFLYLTALFFLLPLEPVYGQIEQNKQKVDLKNNKILKPEKRDDFYLKEIERLLEGVQPSQLNLKKKNAVDSKLSLSPKRLSRMIGQMIIVGFQGTKPSDPGVREVLNQLRLGEIGGVMIMSHNISSPKQLQQLTHEIMSAAQQGKQLAMITVDQEGGWVQRLRRKNGHLSFNYSARTIAKCFSPKQAFHMYKAMACQLRKAGININFGPVVDLDITKNKNPIIGKLKRSYNYSSATVIKYGSAFIAAHNSMGIATVAKHFPGHGSSLTDSHKGFTSIPKWSEKELLPYKRLSVRPKNKNDNSSQTSSLFRRPKIQSNKLNNFTDMIMVGHLYNPLFSDGDGTPASLSRVAIQKSLREQLGYNGLVITDDMEMGAIIRNYPELEDTVIRAINAGNDIILYSNTRFRDKKLGQKLFNIIRKHTKKSCLLNNTKLKKCIEASLIENANDRIKSLKRKLIKQNVTLESYLGSCNIPKLKTNCKFKNLKQ